MRTKVTLVLIFLNVALAFFIFKFERGWRTEQASLEARRRVLGAETADIRTIQISGPSLTTIALERQGENWSLTQPIEWPANPHAVSRIVNELQFLEHVTSFSVADLAKSNQTLADYGLNQPRMLVTFTSGNPMETRGESKPIILRIGDETRSGNRLYVLSPDGKRIHVVPLSLARTLAHPIEDLRADTVFTVPVFEARSLNLQNASNLRTRVRREGNLWSFEAPIIARASKTRVELAINALNALRVQSFATGGTAENNPAANASLRITIEGNNRRETLILGNEVASTATLPPATEASAEAAPSTIEYYAVLDGKSTLFTVRMPTVLVDALRNAQVVLRETKVLEFDPAAVTAIALSSPNQPDLVLQRLESGSQATAATLNAWQIVLRDGEQGPQTQAADDRVVQQLIGRLSLLSALKFVSDAPSDADLETWGFNRPEREITLSLGSGDNATTLKLQVGLSSERDGHAYVRLTNARFVYLVDDAILAQTPVSPLSYRERLLRELPSAAKISELKITDLDGDKVILDQDMTKPGISEPALTLAAQLRSLRAKQFVQNSFTPTVTTGGEERPWRYRVETTLVLPSGSGQQTETMTLFFTERTGGATQLAGSPELGAVFSAEQPLLDALWQLTYGDKDPGPPPPVEVTAPVEAKPATP